MIDQRAVVDDCVQTLCQLSVQVRLQAQIRLGQIACSAARKRELGQRFKGAPQP